ncbi:hypothetical protein NLU13_0224 [Sarocladium strictum]|uniref:Uncharacterized protein n=1 Tax=Sarocladium strictum TaxID=5046 RepID=A0AA39LAM1_SARSR|nr:hypothetical protein NLU13_0224 [Sarocladium strictum]
MPSHSELNSLTLSEPGPRHYSIMSQSQSSNQTLEAKPSKVATSLPVSLLRLLEPATEGEWMVTEQTQRSFVLSFIMKHESEALHYNMSPCLTKADVEKQCGGFIYEWKNPSPSRRSGTLPACPSFNHFDMDEATVAPCTPLSTSVSQSGGHVPLSSESWVQSRESRAQHFTEHPFIVQQSNQMGMSFPVGHGQSPSTSNPSFMNLHGHDTAIQSADWTFSNSALSMGFETASMLASSMDSSIMTPSSIGPAWDPMADFDHDAVTPDTQIEPQVEWDVMWNES